MALSTVSLIALLLAIGLGAALRVNVGILAVVFAYVVGIYVAGMSAARVAAAFPSSLFLTLLGLTSLFALAQANGSMSWIAKAIDHRVGRRVWALPVFFFVACFVVSALGAGNIAAAAMFAPPAMAVAARRGASQFLMALAVGIGANAGGLSPVAPTGVVVEAMLGKSGLEEVSWPIFFDNFLANTIIAAAAYCLFRGWRRGSAASAPEADVQARPRPHRRHVVTLAVIVLALLGSTAFRIDLAWVTLGAFALLVALRMGNEGEAFKHLPVNAILLVCGVTVLIEVMQETGGIASLTRMLGEISTPASVTFMAALIAGIMSSFSSSSGVVLPTLLPTIPGLIEHIGGGEPLAIAGAIVVGAHLVDVSPFSTIGALCLAAAPEGGHGSKLFLQMTAWGGAMVGVGALICFLIF